MTLLVDLYLRKSTKDGGRSVSRQQHDLTEAATLEGLTIGRVFVDPDLSASRFARKARPDYAALLEHIQAGDCQAVGILEASRGSRGLTEWSGFLDLCRKRGVKVWVAAHERVYDLSRRRDWRALADEGLDAADESEKLSERVLSGKRKAARDGKPAGRLQYGFTRTYDASGKLVEQAAHPTEAPIVREWVDRLYAGERLAAIARDLNARGLTMPGGAPWHGRFIRQMVLRPAYAGIRVHHGEELGPASWAPIVDVEKWRQVVAILNQPSRRTTTRGTELAHWLTNAVLCGGCRSSQLRARTGGTHRPRITYQCDTCGLVVAAGSLETVVEKMVLARLGEPDALEVFRPRANDNAAREAEKLAETLTKRLDAHYLEAARGALSARGLSIVEGELLPQIEQARTRARRLALPPALADIDPREAVTRWPSFPPETKRIYVRALAELVVTPAKQRGPVFDPERLGTSRWVGDDRTWAELWRAAAVLGVE